MAKPAIGTIIYLADNVERIRAQRQQSLSLSNGQNPFAANLQAFITKLDMLDTAESDGTVHRDHQSIDNDMKEIDGLLTNLTRTILKPDNGFALLKKGWDDYITACEEHLGLPPSYIEDPYASGSDENLKNFFLEFFVINNFWIEMYESVTRAVNRRNRQAMFTVPNAVVIIPQPYQNDLPWVCRGKAPSDLIGQLDSIAVDILPQYLGSDRKAARIPSDAVQEAWMQRQIEEVRSLTEDLPGWKYVAFMLHRLLSVLIKIEALEVKVPLEGPLVPLCRVIWLLLKGQTNHPSDKLQIKLVTYLYDQIVKHETIDDNIIAGECLTLIKECVRIMNNPQVPTWLYMKDPAAASPLPPGSPLSTFLVLDSRQPYTSPPAQIQLSNVPFDLITCSQQHSMCLYGTQQLRLQAMASVSDEAKNAQRLATEAFEAYRNETEPPLTQQALPAIPSSEANQKQKLSSMRKTKHIIPEQKDTAEDDTETTKKTNWSFIALIAILVIVMVALSTWLVILLRTHASEKGSVDEETPSNAP